MTSGEFGLGSSYSHSARKRQLIGHKLGGLASNLFRRKDQDRTLEQTNREFCYHAVLEKDSGAINARDLFSLSKELVDVCDGYYEGSEVEVVRDLGVPTDSSFVEASQGEYTGPIGTIVEHGLDDDSLFAQGLDGARSVDIRVTTQARQSEFGSSFASIAWTAEIPNKAFLYGQGGRERVGQDADVGHQAELVGLLYQKMFTPPGFRAQFGVRAAIKARTPNL